MDSGSRFAPVRAESTLSYFKVYGVHLDLIDEVNDAIDKTLMEEVESDLEDARDKTMKTLAHYKNNVFTVPGFKSDSLQESPAFRSFLISGYENATKLFATDFKFPLSPGGLPTVTAIIKFKLEHLPRVFPVDNCLAIKRVQRPRFRSTNIDFFKRVNRNLEYFFEDDSQNDQEDNKSFSQVSFNGHETIFLFDSPDQLDFIAEKVKTLSDSKE